jgi:hypothetical protein
MKMGAEDKKKIRALGILGVMLLGAIYYSFFSGPSVPSSSSSPKPAAGKSAVDSATAPAEEESVPRPSRLSQRRAEEFHPVLHSKRKENQVDPTKIDPRIRFDLLAKLQGVPEAGKGRNLFQFGAAPPPDLPKGEGPVVKVAQTGCPPICPPVRDFSPPPTFQQTQHVDPPPPFNAKYYGLATPAKSGRQRAFFLDGEDIIIKAVGETVKGHFRLLRINRDNVVVEDTDNKRQQTVPIAEDAQG